VLGVFPYREKVLECVDKVKRYLVSPKVSFDIVGVNVFGDISKKFDVEAEDLIMIMFRGFFGGVCISWGRKGC
jgi:hypothetical protein